jgi:hypothetical protein
MMQDSRGAPSSPANQAAAADAVQHVQEDLGLRARAAGRTLSRSWVVRAAAAVAGLIAGWLLSLRRRTSPTKDSR